MKTIQITLVFLLLGIAILSASAQPPGGGRPGGSPEEMIEREKQTLYSQLDDLSEDQKLLLDGIYEEFAETLHERMAELRQNNDREGRREQMEALRKEKDELIADVLNADQLEVYQSINRTRQERKRGSPVNP
ncbi:MAG: hypothetical protein RIF33_22220 [Cyclobacteriaceae bacterium]